MSVGKVKASKAKVHQPPDGVPAAVAASADANPRARPDVLLLTAEEMRSLDRRTIEGGHATGLELMRRAGHGVVESIERRYGSLLSLRAIVLCGTGNNGGDGFVAASRLRERGAAVRVVVMGSVERIRGDAALALEAMRAAGIGLDSAATESELG